jgi:hypothetical protein
MAITAQELHNRDGAPRYVVKRSWPGVTRGQLLTLRPDRAKMLLAGGFVTLYVPPPKRGPHVDQRGD